jgi:GDP-L-fucose synthase
LDKKSRIFVAGDPFFIGAAIANTLQGSGFTVCGLENGSYPDLLDLRALNNFFEDLRPEYVFLAGGKSAGINANLKYPAELMLDNLRIQTNVIDVSYRYDVKKLLFLGSSCSYPRLSPQPIPEAALMTGPLEPTNEAYAVAKIAGIKLCEAYRKQYGANFITAIPSNPFGPGEDFSLEDSHVIPSLILKMHDAKLSGTKSVTVWGTGSPRREFLYVDDLANACVFLMEKYAGGGHINIGGNPDLSIKELTIMIAEIIGYSGAIEFDVSKPDGMPLKALDSKNIMDLGWRPHWDLSEALRCFYDWYLLNCSS